MSRGEGEGGEETGFLALRVDFDDLGAREVFTNRGYLSKFRQRRSRLSFDLYFHSGFHFLLFSVRRTRSFSSHVTKRTKGPLSRAET